MSVSIENNPTKRKLIERFPFLSPVLLWLLATSLAVSASFPADAQSPPSNGTIPPPITLPCSGEVSPGAYEYVFGQSEALVNAAAIGTANVLNDPHAVHGVEEAPVISTSLEDQTSWALEAVNLSPFRAFDPPRVVTVTQTITNENGSAQNETITQTKPIIIVIPDSGINSDLPQFEAAIAAGVVVLGYDLVDGDCIPNDQHGHGTFILSELISNNKKISVIPFDENSKATDVPVVIIVVRVLDQYNSTSWAKVIKSLLIAEHLNADFVSMSLGGEILNSPEVPQQVQRTIDFLRKNGTTVLAATGNLNNMPKFYPACADGVVKVVATNQFNGMFTFNNYACNTPGSLSGGAPGTSLLGVWKTGVITQETGTSMATPLFTLATAFEANRNGVENAVERVLKNALVPPWWKDIFGAGILQFKERDTGKKLFLPIVSNQ